MIRRTLSTLAALTLAAGLTACSDDKDDPNTSPTETPSSAEPTPTETAWQDDYTAKQLKAYDAALQRWESYLQRSEPIWAAGKATPQAEDLFKEYFPDPAWRNQFEQLATYEEVEIKTTQQPEIYWSRAKRISKDLRGVRIEQCVLYSSGSTTQRGKPIESAKWATVPRLRTIELSKPKGFDWLIYGVTTAASKPRPERCTP